MSDLSAVEQSTVEALAKSYGEVASETPAVPFEFEEAFQSKIAAHALRDLEFMRRVAHLIKPDYFENIGEAALVNMSLEFYKKYAAVPDAATTVQLIKEKHEKKLLKGEIYDAVRSSFRSLYQTELMGGAYVAEKVADFCRNKATENALLASVEFLNSKNFNKINEVMQEALNVGMNEDGDEYDYFDKIEDRTERRLDIVAGKIKPNGITTGYQRMDDLLYHKGWGKKELSLLMGGAKSGKTTALINFGRMAAMAGKNVLYVTLEVSAQIIADRLDASITDNEMRELSKNIHDVSSKVKALKGKTGKLKIHEFPSGSLSPNMLRRLIERHKNKGLTFDLIVIDYADLMVPDFRMNDAIENSKNIYTGLRAIASEEDAAVLTATQTNRDGFKSTVAKAEHVAEDFNKIRIADLVISINATEEERAVGEARLYFAASRNQETGFSIFIKQEIAKMKFITAILKVE